VRWPREGTPVFASHFATWDAAHYLYLSEVGYRHNASSWAFYPLWPLLVRWVSPLFGRSHLVGGLVLSNLFSLAAWLIFYRMVTRRWGESAADWGLLFLITFPGSLFFQFNYSESLFLLLVMALWWGLEERHYGWAWVAGCLLPLTRGVGVFALLPIGWYVIRPMLPRRFGHNYREGDAVLASGDFSGPELKTREGANQRLDVATTLPSTPPWLLLAPLLGWGLYLVLIGYWTGDPFEGFRAQKYWGVHSISNLWNMPKFVGGLFTPTEWHAFKGSVLDRCVFLLLLGCLPIIWRLDKALLAWTYVLGILPAMSGTFTSFTRFASCSFPMFIALGVFLSWREWCWLRYGLVGVFIVLHVVLVWRFVNFRWAG